MSSFHAVEALPNRSCLGSPLSEGSDSQVLSNSPPGWSKSLSWPVTGWRGYKLTGEELSRCRGRMGQCFGDFPGLPSNISPSCFAFSDVKRAQTNLHMPVRAFEVMQYAGIRLDELRLGQKKKKISKLNSKVSIYDREADVTTQPRVQLGTVGKQMSPPSNQHERFAEREAS